MKRQTKSLAAILGVALLLSSVAGCARRGGTDVTAAPSAQPASPTAIVAAQPSEAEPTEPAVTDTTLEPTSTDSPAAAVAPANPTADPLDAQLQNVNQLLNGIDTSISGSNGGGGE